MRRYIVITLLILLAVFLCPQSVYATESSIAAGWASDAAGWMMQQLNGALELAQRFVTSLLTQLGNLMGSMIRLDLTDGGPAVYQVWKLFRDMCNALFIVMFVLVAFGTIFNSLKPNSFMYSSALKYIIIAALLINFSLAIGRTLVIVGNQASLFVLNLFPKVDIGTIIALNLKVPAVVANINGSSVPIPPVGTIPTDQFNPDQKLLISRWMAAANTGGSAQATLALNDLRGCLARNVDASTCLIQANNKFRGEWAVADNNIAKAQLCVKNSYSGSVPKSVEQCYREAGVPAALIPQGVSLSDVLTTAKGLFTFEMFKATPRKDPAGNLSAQMGLFVNNLLSFVLLLTLVLSFLCVLIFMVVRLPAIWFLLATSALAFFALSVPNSGYFKKWFNNLLGWCIFSPLYLFVIYIGLYFIEQSGPLMASLSNEQLPFFVASFGSILYFFIAAFIFIRGATWALSFSQSLSNEAGAVFGQISGALGADNKSMFGLKTMGTAFGVSSRVEGARAGIASLYKEKVTEPFARRGEMATARYQAKFGDKRALETLNQKRISEQFKKNEEAGFSMSDLKTDFTNTNNKGSPKYFAAAKALLNAGELDPTQMNEYVAEATKLSPAYGRAVKESVEKKIKERSKEKKFKDAEDVNNVLKFYEDKPGSDPEKNKKARDAILKSLEENQPLIAADLAKNGHYWNPDGSSADAAQVLERNTKGLDNDAWAKILEKDREGDLTMSPKLKEILGERTRKLSDYSAIAGRLKSPEDEITLAQISALDEQMQAAKAAKRGRRRAGP